MGGGGGGGGEGEAKNKVEDMITNFVEFVESFIKMQKCMGKHYEVREFEKIYFHPFLIFFHALKLALKQHNNKIILFVVLVPNKGLK